MESLDANAIIWRVFMSVTLQAVVHLGKNDTDNLHSINNQPKRTLEQLSWNCGIDLLRYCGIGILSGDGKSRFLDVNLTSSRHR